MTIDAIYDEALALPDDERAELVDRLLGSLPAELPSELHPAWRNVVRRRGADLESGAVPPIPWDEVRRAAWKAIDGTSPNG